MREKNQKKIVKNEENIRLKFEKKNREKLREIFAKRVKNRENYG